MGTEGTLRTYVVCRKRFDQYVVQQGMEAGAELWLNTVPTSAEREEEGVRLTVLRDGETVQLTTKLRSAQMERTVGHVERSKWADQRN